PLSETTYYASQTDGNCESDRTAVVVSFINEVDAGTVSGTATLCISEQSQLSTNGDTGGVWSSSDDAIATVDSNGLVTAHAEGEVDITYTINTGCGAPDSDTLEITVNPNVNAGTITGVSPLCISDVEVFTSNGNPGGEWTSSDPTVASVDINSGEVT